MLLKYILVTNKTNIRYLSGFSGTAGFLLMHGEKGFLLTDSRYHLVAKAVLPQNFELVDTTGGFETAWRTLISKNHIHTLGIEGGDMSLRTFRRIKKISREVQLADIGETLSKRRIVKKKEELVRLRKAQHITDQILEILRKKLRIGMSEREIAWKIETLAHELGAEDISFPPIIGINEHSASPHHQNSGQKLKRGDLILIDMGVIFQGYCSDMTRVFFTKTPTTEQKNIYELVRKAQETAIRKLHAGITGKTSDAFARQIIEKAGFGKYFGHSLGHGVGLDIHELPNLSKKYSDRIPAGSVVTIEPGVYLPGKFGVRLEDMVLVKKDRVENLTASPKAIQDVIIKL